MSRELGVSGVVLSLQFVLGLTAFFSFFGAMFNGLDQLMVTAAVIGLAINLIVSALAARKGIIGGVLAAVVFGSPALLFSVFSLGDAIVLGKPGPFLFWSSAAIVSIVSGLLGVLLVHRLSEARSSA